MIGTFTFKPDNWRDEAAKNYMFTSMTQTYVMSLFFIKNVTENIWLLVIHQSMFRNDQ